VIDRHRDDIAAELRRSGLVVTADVGLSDFRVDLVIADPDEPDQPLLAVLLAGTEWYGRRTVGDRDGLPVEVLSRMLHWPGVERVWLPEWLSHREATVTRLRDAVAAAKRRLSEPVLEDVTPPAVAELVVTPPVSAVEEAFAFRSATTTPPAPAARPRHPNLVDFSAWMPIVVGDIRVLDEIHGSYNKSQVVKVIESIIESEGPVHRDRLAKLVAGAFSLGKVAEARRVAIQRVVPADYIRANDPDFYWPNGVDPIAWRTVRTSKKGEGRRVGEISLVEIGNAMTVVAEQSGGIAVEDLKRDALALFGGVRITRDVGARLAEALDRALVMGTLKQSPSGIVFVA
jgi:hypothetical protein